MKLRPSLTGSLTTPPHNTPSIVQTSVPNFSIAPQAPHTTTTQPTLSAPGPAIEVLPADRVRLHWDRGIDFSSQQPKAQQLHSLLRKIWGAERQLLDKSGLVARRQRGLTPTTAINHVLLRQAQGEESRWRDILARYEGELDALVWKLHGLRRVKTQQGVFAPIGVGREYVRVRGHTLPSVVNGWRKSVVGVTMGSQREPTKTDLELQREWEEACIAAFASVQRNLGQRAPRDTSLRDLYSAVACQAANRGAEMLAEAEAEAEAQRLAWMAYTTSTCQLCHRVTQLEEEQYHSRRGVPRLDCGHEYCVKCLLWMWKMWIVPCGKEEFKASVEAGDGMGMDTVEDDQGPFRCCYLDDGFNDYIESVASAYVPQ